MANAPQAIWDLWHRVEAEYNGPGLQDEELAGIVGDAAHSFGFHLSPNELPAGDYSLRTARDKAGAAKYPNDASALDIHFGAQGMVNVTKRLIASANNPSDHRLDCLYEFCGTTNGRTPHPYTVDTNTDDPNNTQGWDSSHVTHVHLSIHRDVCNTFTALSGVADVIAGASEDIVDAATIDAIATAAGRKVVLWDIADGAPVAPLYKVLVNTQAAVADLQAKEAARDALLLKIAAALHVTP